MLGVPRDRRIARTDIGDHAPKPWSGLIADTHTDHHEDDVTDHPCEACQTRPAPRSLLCSTCIDQLIAEIARVGGYRGLAYDLDIAISKQAVFRRGGASARSDERPILIDERASDAAGALKAVLAHWARVIVDETGADRPIDTLSSIATWLRRRVRWLTHHPQAAQAHAEILDAIRDARIAVDRPSDRVYVGQCDCSRVLYARPGDRWAVCRDEAHDTPLMWPVDERREWLMEQAADFVGTTTQISMALSRYARPVTPAVIRGLAFRGKITPLGADERGRQLWRLGDVLAVVSPEVTCEDVAC
jgi:hypothetical protein